MKSAEISTVGPTSRPGILGRKPGILVALDFEFIEVEAGKAVFAGTPGEHAYNPAQCMAGMLPHRWTRLAAAPCIRVLWHR